MAMARNDLKDQILIAALACTNGELSKTFTFEELLVKAWKRDPQAWGLRGFESEHPDSERIHRELDSRGKDNKGLVAEGVLEKVGPRVYRLTAKGLNAASKLTPENAGLRQKADRILETKIRSILEHPSFIAWLKDPTSPKYFRDAGHFWGVAPGTPPRVISGRIQEIDDTLHDALELLDRRGVEEVSQGKGRLLYDRTDLRRCVEFSQTLKERFVKDLRLLGVEVRAVAAEAKKEEA
jgi:hypothetical protein